MRNYLIGVLQSELGVQRDGTAYHSKAYIDGQWVRFYEGVPTKMAGCDDLYLGDETIVRSLYVVSQTSGINLYMGRAPTNGGVAYAPGSVQYIGISTTGVVTSPVDRTPTDPIFIPNLNQVWDFDAGNFNYTDQTNTLLGASNLIFAHVAINDVSSTDVTDTGGVYAGLINDMAGNPVITPLYPVYSTELDGGGNPIPVTASGGILYCAPVMIAYGNNGTITWTPVDGSFKIGNATTPGTWDTTPTGNTLVVSSTKIIKAANTRGSGSPTVLLWSLTSLSRATLTQVTQPDNSVITTFVNTVVQDNISIISGNSVVNYQQQFFWIGTDQFYVYNGIVQSLPNTMNNDWFFLNVDTAQRSKIWGVAVPRYKEVWWFYVRKGSGATECNAAIIYNVESNVWYDNTIYPPAPPAVYPFTRAAGVAATANYPFPIYSDSTLVSNPLNPTSQTYPVWTHEIGVNRSLSTQTYAIDSYFTTSLLDLWTQDGTNTNLLNNWRIAPDFLQTTAPMTLMVNRQMYPNSPIESDGPYTFLPTTEFIDLSSQGGLCSFTFESNAIGGNYQAGKILYFYNKGDTLK